jgi:formate hydrogenlyase subunit 4
MLSPIYKLLLKELALTNANYRLYAAYIIINISISLAILLNKYKPYMSFD